MLMDLTATNSESQDFTLYYNSMEEQDNTVHDAVTLSLIAVTQDTSSDPDSCLDWEFLNAQCSPGVDIELR